ncbi:MAG TPA: heavy metal translocating P-type ATPase [Bryobacteraceae bacterium]|jgi:Cu2+-exporting ATPase|nr:heavy metal translocating P-type ATPase [Bryobacteraceae bacterium]
MQYEVRHAIPGRLRIYIRAVRYLGDLAPALQQLIEQQADVTAVEVRTSSGSVVIHYDPQVSGMRERMEGMLAAAKPEHLRRALSAWAEAKPEDRRAEARPAAGWRSMLIPTGGLALTAIGTGMAALPLIAISTLPTFKRGIRVLTAEKRVNVDFLDSVAISLSLARGGLFVSALMGWLARMSDVMRDKTAAASNRAIGNLFDYPNSTCRVAREGATLEVKASEVQVGDIVIVSPGDRVPVDGIVVEGAADVDQSAITGEGTPSARHPGAWVYAGSAVLQGKLNIKAERVGEETALAQAVRVVAAASTGDTRMQNYAEKFADRIAAPTLGVALSAYALTRNVDRLVSMLVIDYGTGIRVSAPTAMLSSMTHATRRGIVIKSGRALEKLAEADTILFDKTGTLTTSVPQLLPAKSYSKAHSASDVLALAAAAEAGLNHPISQAVVAKAAEAGIATPECMESTYHVGLGVEARMKRFVVRVGSPRFLSESGIDIERAATDLARLHRRGCSALLLACDHKLTGLLPYTSEIRPESADMIAALRVLGIRSFFMVTGDNAQVAAAVSVRLGLDRFYADVRPAEKATIIEDLRREGRSVIMVGDGVNDSAALASADVGIAMKNGADVAREIASVVLMDEDLWKIVTAIELSRQSMHLVRQSYGITTGMNVLAFALALPTGLVNPATTTILSHGSAIAATANAMRPLLNRS